MFYLAKKKHCLKQYNGFNQSSKEPMFVDIACKGNVQSELFLNEKYEIVKKNDIILFI